MTEPRFKFGESVVIHKCSNAPEDIGQHGQVCDMEFAEEWEWSEGALHPPGWHYAISFDPDSLYHESDLRPCEPLGDWDDEDTVWRPDALKEMEAA